jgi:hypothetical protein
MKITSLDIVAQVERLAEECPWDTVSLWIYRTPEGLHSFTSHLNQQDKFGFPSVFGSGGTPSEAVDDVLKQCGARAPEIARDQKIEELRKQIEKLQAVTIGIPPYRPNRELSNGEPAINAQKVVDV